MPNKTVKLRPRCLICNCSSHRTVFCNSNMNGRRSLLNNMRNCMMDDKKPDFNSFAINELRFIILLYEDTLKCILFPRTHCHPHMIKIMRTPIPLTLPKTRMVKELLTRWHMFNAIRQIKKMKPDDGDDCPICMECMETPVWSSYKCKWNMLKAYVSLPNAMFPDNKVITECGHHFCGRCWESHIRMKHRDTDIYWRGPNADHVRVSCPLCRHRMSYIVPIN